MIISFILIALVLAVALGYKTKINIGLFAIAFAYAIGSFGMGLKPSEIIRMWPMGIFFVIFAVCLFYGVATVNGTLEKLADHLLYRCRQRTYLLPFALFLTASLIAAMGAGYYTVLAFIAPITLLLCQRTGMGLMVGAMSANYGALIGANFMSSQSGVIFRGLMTNNGISSEQAFVNSSGIFAATFILAILVIAGLTFFGANRSATKAVTSDIAPPAAFEPKQRTTLWLTVLMMALVLLAPIAVLILPGNATAAYINGKMDVGLIAVIFAVIALLMNLADERKVLSTIPWSTIIMICGMGMLISVAIKAGVIHQLGSWIGDNVPLLLVPLVLASVAGLMSLFASTIGVVTPALFPIVPPIATSLNIDPMLLYVCIVIGAQATSISPFSSGGSLILGSCRTDESRDQLFNTLLFKCAPLGFIAAVLMGLVLVVIF